MTSERIPGHSNECTDCGRYRAEFWVCDECETARRVDADPASDHDPDAHFANG